MLSRAAVLPEINVKAASANGCVRREAGPLRNQPWSPSRHQGQQRVDTSSWQDGEAAVRPCLTLERQVTNTLLPDCAIKPPAAEADQETVALGAAAY